MVGPGRGPTKTCKAYLLDFAQEQKISTIKMSGFMVPRLQNRQFQNHWVEISAVFKVIMSDQIFPLS